MRNEAKKEILQFLLGHPTILSNHWGLDGFAQQTLFPVMGDIVSMQNSKNSDFYLSLVVDISEETFITSNKSIEPSKILLESLETGETKWFKNSQINVIKRDLLQKNPHWLCTDLEYKKTENKGNNLKNRNEAKKEILNTVLKTPTFTSRWWKNDDSTDKEERSKVGDIVSINFVGRTDFYLSLVLDVEEETKEKPRRILLESFETGETCWFENIGINVLDRDYLEDGWLWSDEQYLFKKYIKSFFGRPYNILVSKIDFLNEEQVELDVFINGRFSNPKLFKWKEISDNDVLSYLENSLTKYNQQIKKEA